MKKIYFILLVSVLLLLTSVSVFAAGSVYELDGKNTAFLSNSETVTYDGNEYSAFSSLGDAIKALSTAGGDAQAIVVGDFHMSDNTADVSYHDPVDSLVIKGADSNAIFNQYRWIELYTGPVTIDNITWNGVASKGLIAQDLTITDTVKTTGKKQYVFGYEYTSPIDKVRMEINGGNFLIAAAFYGTTTVGSADNPGSVYMELNGDVVIDNYVFAGGNSGKSTVNGNIFLVLNGGTYNTKAEDNISFYNLNAVTGKKIAVVNNGLYETVKPYGYDILVASPAGGLVTVDETTLENTAPTIILTPDSESYAPYINGAMVEKSADGYKFNLSENGDYTVTWEEIVVDTIKNIDVIDGKNTVFLSNNEIVTYNDKQYFAFASLGDAIKALSTAGGDAQAIVVGDFHMTDRESDMMIYTDPVDSLVIKGADSNAIFNQYTWIKLFTGPVTIDNIKWNGKANKGLCSIDLTITESVTATGQYQYIFGYDYSSPVQSLRQVIKGSKYILVSSFYNTTTVGSESNPGYVYTQLDGGESQYYVFAGGNSGKSTVYGNVFLVINGGKYSGGLEGNVQFRNLETVTGKKIAILNNGMSASVAPTGYDILVTSHTGGTVTVEESTLSSATPVVVLTPDSESYAPYINGAMVEKSADGYKFNLTQNGDYTVTWEEIVVDTIKNIDVIDGKNTVFLSNDEIVTYNGKQYYTYASLGDAINALSEAKGHGQAIVVGNYTMSDGTTSQTYTAPIDSLTIKGADENAIFNHPNIWIEFYTGPVILDNITWNGVGNQGLCYGDLTMTETVKMTGKIQYFFGYDYKSPIEYTKTVIKGGKFLVTSSFYGTTTVGSPEKNGYVLMQVDGGDCQYYVYCGGNTGSSTVYGNMFLIINGGNITTGHSGGVCFQKLANVTGKKIAILNYGLKSNITPVGHDVLVTSAVGGTVTVDESTYTATSPVLILTPDSDELAPYVNNEIVEKKDGKYTYAITENGELNITWGEPAAEEELKSIDVIDGKQTVFLSNAEFVTYNGVKYKPYVSLGQAINVLSATGEDSQMIVVGDYHMAENSADSTFTAPIKSLVIKGADSNAVFNQYTWLEFYTGPVTIDNIKWNGKVGNKGICSSDLTITESVTTTGNSQYLFGYDISTPVQNLKQVIKGSKYLVISSFYSSTTVGSESNPGYVYTQLDGGECQYYVYAGGNHGSSTVYGNVFLVINGGKYSNGLGGNVTFNRLEKVTGKKIAILNNGMSASVAPVGYDILVTSEIGGTVTVEESTLSSTSPVLVLTPDAGSDKVPFVNGKSVTEENGKYTFSITEDGIYEIGWAEIPEGFYFVNGLPTIFLSNDGTVTIDGVEYQTFSSITEAMNAVCTTTSETQMIVCGNYHPDERTDLTFSGKSGHLIITGLDENAIFNQYAWLKFHNGPVTIKNLTWNNVEVKALACTDLTIEDNVKMTGKSMYLFGSNTTEAIDSIDMKVGAGKYIVVAAFDASKTIGSQEKNGSVYMELNGGKYEYYVFAGGNSGNSTIYGNIFLVINAGTFNNGLTEGVKFNKLATVTGKKVAVVNNGLSTSVAPVDYDILVNSGYGGTVSIEEKSRASETPVIILTPQSGTTNIPFINGKIADIEDGVYKYTLSQNGIYEVEWKELSAQSYIIDGVKTVFMSDKNVVLVDNEYYVPYSTLTDAFAALGTEGGHAIVCDDFTPTDNFVDVVGRNKVTIFGQDRFAIFHQTPNFTFSGGPVEFRNLTIHVVEAYTYLGGFDITIGEGVTTSSEGAGLLYVTGGCKAQNVDKVRVTVNSGTFGQIGAGGVHNGFVIGSPDKRGSSIVTLNGGNMSSSYFMSGGAYRNTTTYGNIYIIANSGDFGSERTLLDTQLTKGDEDSRIIVLFNGTGAVMTTDVADVVINSKKGGNVVLDETTAESTTPIFVLYPDENMIPFVDGEMLEMTNGRYEITITKDVTEVNIEWNKKLDLSFDLNGGQGPIPENISIIVGQSVELPSGENITKADNVFVGWNTDKNATNGLDVISDADSNILYAIWRSTVPRITDNPNLEANGVRSVYITVETLDKDVIENANIVATSDPVFLGEGVAEYTFKVTAYNEDATAVDFENGINFVIPSDIYSYSDEAFKFVRLYVVNDDKAELVDEISIKDDGIYFTAYKSGIFVLAANTLSESKYMYSVKESDGKVTADFYYNGKPTQSGFFGITYKVDALENATFTYAEGITSAGNDFGIYTNEGGIFFDAFELETENDADLFIGSEDSYVYIGTLTFDKLKDEYNIDPFNTPEETIDGYTYGKGLVYIPYCESSYTFFQPATMAQGTPVATIGNKVVYDSLEMAVNASADGDNINLLGDVVLDKMIQLKDNTTLVLNYQVSGEKIKLSETSKVISSEYIMSMLCADTLVGYNFENGVYTFVASPYSSDYLVFDGVQIRLTGNQALRFVATVNDSVENCGLSDYGFIIIPEDISEYANTNHETARVGEVSLKLRGQDFRYYKTTSDSFSFTVCITNIGVNNYNRKFVARPFVRYEMDGVEYTIYTEYESKYNLSVYDVATGILNANPNSSSADQLRDIIKEYDEYIESDN